MRILISFSIPLLILPKLCKIFSAYTFKRLFPLLRSGFYCNFVRYAEPSSPEKFFSIPGHFHYPEYLLDRHRHGSKNFTGGQKEISGKRGFLTTPGGRYYPGSVSYTHLRAHE